MPSQMISVEIEQSFDQVYGFLADPQNFPSWSPVHGSHAQFLQGSDWLVEGAEGPMVIRYTEPNLYGVLDFVIFGPGKTPGPATPSRLVRTETGCELIMVWRQRAGVSDEQFQLETAGISAYFRRLKSLLEAAPTE